MTEMEFLKIFNDIEDKFVDEEIEGEIEPLSPVTVNPNGAKNRFFWVKFAGIAAACALVAGGLVYLKNNPNLVADPSVTERESSVQNNAPELGANSTLYQTKLNCNNNSYDVRIFLTEIDEEESLNDENYIWGEAAMELSLNGEVLDTVEIYENSYMASAYGTPFDRETLGSDYFKVISMEQDVLAFISPNAAMHNVVLDNNYDALLNARFFTVNKEGKIAPIERYATEEEKKEIDTGAEAWIEPAYLFFKITPSYDVNGNRITCHLDRQVMNPWWVNGTVYEKGDVPISFDFENYTLSCENADYKYLIYNAEHIFDIESNNITLLDGTFAKEEDIKELSPNPNNPEMYDYFTANAVFAVPFFTPMEGRTPWRAGDWIKLRAGDTIGGFTVVSAESYYILPSGLYFPAGYVAKAELKGNLSCTATAEKDYKLDGTSYTGNVKITLDRESCEKLFSLSFNSGFNRSFEEERICFFLPESENDELFQTLCVQGRESVKIKIEADSFAMRYTHETGNSFDNQSIISFTDSDYSIELAEEEKAVTEKDKLNEKIYNAVASAETVEELTQNISPYKDSFYRFAVYSVYYPGNPNNSIVIKSGKLRDGMVCIIYYDESEKNIRGIPIIKKTDEKLILMDGSIATKEDIKELHTDPNDPDAYNYFTINAAFAVPFFTPAEGRTSGKPGEWIKLKAGDKFGDFTVVNAESTYLRGIISYYPGSYTATVELKGNLSCTGTAEKAYGIDGTLYNDSVLITLDRESCEKLFSLAFNSGLFDENFDEERIRFFLPVSENDELYNALLVQNKESVMIKLETDSFKMRYNYETGIQLDRWSTMNLNDSDYSIEIVQGKNLTLMDGSAAADDEILSEDEKTFTVNSCFAVPFSTVNGNRQAGEKGDWIKLKEGDSFGDYTVESAESTYTKSSEGVFPPYKSEVDFLGKLSCTGTAKIIPDPAGYDGLVELTLDEDCCQKLIGLAPCLDNDFSDSPSQDRIYMWMTYKTKDYQPIIDKLQNTESVRVKLETEHFSLGYRYGSEYWYDGKVMLNSVGNEHSLEIID